MRFDVFGELFGERAQDAGHHDLLLDGEVAAVAVGDVLQPAGDCGKVVVVADAGLESLKVLSDCARTKFAGRALTARFNGQKPGEAVGGVDHASGVVVDDETGRAHRAADSAEPLVTDRDVKVGGLDDSVRDAGEHSLDRSSRADTAAHGVDDGSQRRSHLHLADIGRNDVANDGGHDRAGRFGGAH